jgi:dCMP deaminase
MSNTWHNYFMEMAHHVASRSKDPNTKVGCVVASADKVVVATGYNGIPRGVEDLPERMERPAKYLWTAHAEENAVAQAARVGARLDGGVVYVTHQPCSRCARSLIQAGIRTVYVGAGTTNMPPEEFEVARQMFAEAQVFVLPMQPEGCED